MLVFCAEVHFVAQASDHRIVIESAPALVGETTADAVLSSDFDGNLCLQDARARSCRRLYLQTRSLRL